MTAILTEKQSIHIMQRQTELKNWLTQCYPNQSFELAFAAADADFRRYFRAVFADGGSVICMDAPPEKMQTAPYVRVQQLFQMLNVPQILHHSPELGFMVLNDLGDVQYLKAMQHDPSPDALKSQGVGKLLVLPLYPQYAGSCTGAALDNVWREIWAQRNQMAVCSISRFYDHPAYIRALAQQIHNYRAQHGSGDLLMFSFHGIPQRHSDLGDPYADECRRTAQLTAKELGLTEKDYVVSFQSRFGKNKWIEPSTQTLFSTLPKKQGVRRLDVICPGFVSDCLETMEEIAIAGREQFHAAGGEQFHYIPCLNDNPEFLDALVRILQDNSAWLAAAES